MNLTSLLPALVFVVAACNPGSTSAASSAPIRVAGPASCAADQAAEDLTLSGGMTGHLMCSTVPVPCHRIHGPGSPGLKMAVLAKSGGSFVTIQIIFGNDHVGTFAVTSISDAPNLDQQGVTVSGAGDWSSQSGTLTVIVEQSPSLSAQGRVSGSLDVKVVSGSNSAKISGSWTCFKTLAGGDGWSSA